MNKYFQCKRLRVGEVFCYCSFLRHLAFMGWDEGFHRWRHFFFSQKLRDLSKVIYLLMEVQVYRSISSFMQRTESFPLTDLLCKKAFFFFFLSFFFLLWLITVINTACLKRLTWLCFPEYRGNDCCKTSLSICKLSKSFPCLCLRTPGREWRSETPEA